MLSFDSKSVQGVSNIMAHYASLPFQSIQHKVVSFDAQASGVGGIIIIANGDVCSWGTLLSSFSFCVQIKCDANMSKFSETFHIMPSDPEKKNWWILNDIFRLS